MDQAKSLLRNSEKINKTAKETDKIKKEITIMEDSLGLKAVFWGAEEIMALLLILERSAKTGEKIVIQSLYRKYGLVKVIFRTTLIEIPEDVERRVSMALNAHVKNRLNEEEPTEDGTHPMLSPLEWKRIQKWILENARDSTEPLKNKKYMSMLAISIGFSTGLRLAEIHRLKFSDIDLNGQDVIRFRIRWSKSNRRGTKKVWQVAPVFAEEPLLCPAVNLLRYIEEMKKDTRPDAFIFANDRKGYKNTDIDNLTTNWKNGAEGLKMDPSRWPMAHSFHNAKINMGRALGYSDEEISDAMNWCSSSVLQQYLRRVNEKKEGIAYRLTSMSAEDLTKETQHLWN